MSKVALFSVADYSWNNAGFNNTTSYKAAVKAIVGNDDADDFSFLCDYLRWNDPTAFGTLLNNVKTRITNPSNTYSKQLRERMERLKTVCAKFVAYKDSERECDRLLYADISPWLLKLQSMVGITLDMMDAAQSQAELEERWTGYVAALEEITDIDVNTIYTAYALEGMGGSVSWRQAQTSQKNFYPFVKWMRENILKDAFGTGEEKHKAIRESLFKL